MQLQERAVIRYGCDILSSQNGGEALLAAVTKTAFLQVWREEHAIRSMAPTGITQLTLLTTPFIPLFAEDPGNSRMRPKELQAGKYSSGMQTEKCWESYFYSEQRGNGHMYFLSDKALCTSSLPPCSHKQKQVHRRTSLAWHLPIPPSDEQGRAQREATLQFPMTFKLQDPISSVLFRPKYKAQFANDNVTLKQKFSLWQNQELIPQSSLDVLRPSHLFQ